MASNCFISMHQKVSKDKRPVQRQRTSSQSSAILDDQRPEAAAQRKVTQLVNKSPQVRQLRQKVAQLSSSNVIQRGPRKKKEKGEEDKRKKRRVPLIESPKAIMLGGRSLRSNTKRLEKRFRGMIRSSGKRPGTRGFNGATADRQKAIEQLGIGQLPTLSGPPTHHAGRRIWNGNRSSLSFSSETEGHVYGSVPQRNLRGRQEYHVGGKWLPRKRDASIGEKKRAQFTSIDHHRDFAETSRELPRHVIEHEGHEWEFTYHDDAQEMYDNRHNLKLMSQSKNSSKSGKKGMDHMGPKRGKKLKKEEPEITTEAPDIPWNKDHHDPPPPPPPGAQGISVF